MDKNTVVAFFLIAVVIFAWPFYMDLVAPEKPSTTTAEYAPPPVSPTREKVEASVVTPPSPILTTAISLAEEKEYLTSIENDLFQALVSNKNGGSLLSFRLKQYQTYDSTLVELIDQNNIDNLMLSYVSSVDGQKIDLNNYWHIDNYQPSIKIGENNSISLRFFTSVNSQQVEKTITFNHNTYQLIIHTNLGALTNFISQGTYNLFWPGGLPGTEKNKRDDLTYFKGYVYQAGELHSPKPKAELKMEHLIGQTDWVAVRTKYFVASLIPEFGAPSSAIGGVVLNGGKDKTNLYSVSVAQDVNKPSNVSLYLGPLEYQRIKGLEVRLERIMNFGWSFIRPIAKGVLYLLTKMHNSIPNYGVVLIIFAILVKILVFPLTKKSHQSTKEMQAIQPLVNELKEKYKNNPQKLNQETMSLYKEHGVNPLGGCLPLLLQMPLLFALFQVFRSTIELRGAHFVWWIKDLSSPDTIFYLPFNLPIYGDQVSVLPIVMGISMFIQQKMMPAQASGQQKYMSYFMTGFFMLLFNNFPSGLNLYYTLFNVLTILQQKYLTPQQHQAVVVPNPPKQKHKKGLK
ncbi:MAG: membrane protein insertase YidC [Candidatus Neomarinimicrobiota bacterium]